MGEILSGVNSGVQWIVMIALILTCVVAVPYYINRLIKQRKK